MSERVAPSPVSIGSSACALPSSAEQTTIRVGNFWHLRFASVLGVSETRWAAERVSVAISGVGCVVVTRLSCVVATGVRTGTRMRIPRDLLDMLLA